MKFLSRSLLALLALYGMVFALGTAVLAEKHVSLVWALLFSVGFIALQYAISPAIIEWVLSIDWDENELPAVNRAFIDRLCLEKNIPKPRIGIIHSGTPNAFSFGRVRSDARVVVTKGLLDVLTPEEANAVLAHEIGHIQHYDFAVMAVAAVAPLLLYQIFVWTRGNDHTRPVAAAAYACYWVGQYLVLTLNRTREFYADHFSAEVTQAPGDLSSALIKIAYGMVKADGEFKEKLKSGSAEQKRWSQREQKLGGAISLLGIANLKSSQSLAIAVANPEQAAAVMRWDLVNPWSRFYQLGSTHPLTAFRVRALNNDSEAMHQQVRYPLPGAQASDRKLRFLLFPFEFLVWVAPWICGFLFLFQLEAVRMTTRLHLHSHLSLIPRPWLLVALGFTWMLRIAYRYRGTFAESKIQPLIEDTEVSQMRPRPVVLRGEIVGHGVPGAFWSADLVLRDETGMMFVLYRASIPFARLFFAMTNADRIIGEQVTVEGWFRRGLMPYVEISKLTAHVTKAVAGAGPVSLFGQSSKDAIFTEEIITQRSYSRWIQYALAATVTAAGILWLRS
ncbi:MAG: M48 family metalloprotease [Edaphobacter sp.]